MRILKSFFLVGFLAVLFAGCEKTEYVTEYVKPDYGYKSALAALDWGNDITYVIGHKSPDVDAVTSALSYASLMRAIGYNCVPAMAGEANNEMKYVARTWNLPLPQNVTHVEPGTRLILTDHSGYAQAVDGADQARILQVIDHHGLGDIKEANTLIYKALPVGSTCTVVYSSFEELGVEPSDEDARIMLAGILSDTDYLTKTTTTPMDSMVLERLVKKLNLTKDSVNSFYLAMKEAYHDYSEMTEEQILLSDYKEYNIEGVSLGIGCVDWYDTPTIDNILTRLLNAMPELEAKHNLEMLFAIVNYYVPNTDSATQKEKPKVVAGSYILYDGVGAKTVAEKAFGTSVREGVCFSSTPLVRKTGVVPAITAALKSLQ